eukprot:10612303-Lingulodinium_polyedra.AAC.1
MSTTGSVRHRLVLAFHVSSEEVVESCLGTRVCGHRCPFRDLAVAVGPCRCSPLACSDGAP